MALALLRSFLADRNVASIVPTRRAGVVKFLSELHFSPNSIIVEYGPGTGAFTEVLLERLDQRGKLIAVELNPVLAQRLRALIPDTRLVVAEGPAQLLQQELQAELAGSIDLVVSGVPLSFFSEFERRQLFQQTSKLLKSSGKFFIYQSAWTPFRSGSELLRELSSHFKVEAARFFWSNLPPLVGLKLKNRSVLGAETSKVQSVVSEAEITQVDQAA